MQGHWIENSEKQNRQYVDAQGVLRAHLQAQKDAKQVRGSMIWREMRGVRYLIRTSVTGAQKSLGQDSEVTRKIHTDFSKRKEISQERVKSLSAAMDEQRKLNKVFFVGRVPRIALKILQALSASGLADNFLIVGTHAMYAYESACGVRVSAGALATQDIDLLFDSRKRLAFLSLMQGLGSSFVEVLQKADPSFQVLDSQLQTAVNKDGFEVDVIRRTAIDGDPHPMRMTDNENDLWAVQVPSGQEMLSGRMFEQIVVSTSGHMALMKTLHPLDFIRIKNTIGNQVNRDPLKRPKDLLQADTVQRLWDEWLCHREESRLGTAECLVKNTLK